MGDSNRFASANLTAGQLNAMVKSLMRQTGIRDANEAVQRFNADEFVVSSPVRSWREEDGVIYFSVTSDGTTGEDWIKRLEGSSSRVDDATKEVLRSPTFKPTRGVTTEVAVIRGCFFEDNDRITKKIRAYAEAFRTSDRRKLCNPEPELACLIRGKFTNKEIKAMGLQHVVVMHEPFFDSISLLRLLGARCDLDDRNILYPYLGHPDCFYYQGTGFAYKVSRVSPQP